ncbi:hypothetical protein [Roseobacter sinensis]|uniref:Uncharacterized protein n=1 Tax=Roseobacter sinensis TaxID=2931391 RepID=A0ABT3BDX3_9RHOB|nr:hypothetical protein [Roseobacter sp. WL0113]MCV3271768.1 hypothetical protein [Roseobacter sp. WL0113]
MPVFIHVFAFAFAALAGPVLALASAKPVPGEIMLAIGPAAVLHEAVALSHSGRVLGPELARFGVLVQSDQTNFAPVLLENGDWFVVDGRRIAAICGVDI